MDAFTIQCTTCQSKLRVRDPHLLHQIVNCPKCNSLLQVEPPQRISVTAVGQTSVDSAAMTREAIPSPLVDESPYFSSLPTIGPAGAASTINTGDGDSLEDEFRLAPLEDDAPPSAAEPSMQDSDWQPDKPLLNPSDEWTSPTAAKSRQYLLVSFIGLVGIALAGLLFMLFLRWIDKSTVSPDPTQLAAGDGAVEVAKPDDSGIGALAPATGDAAAGNAAAGDAAGVDINNDDSTNNVDNDALDPKTNRQTDVTTLPDATDAASLPDGASLPDAASLPDGASPDALSPLNASPDDTDDSVGTNTADPNAGLAPDGTTSPAPTNPLPKQLEAFADLLNYQVIPVLPDTQVEPTQAPLTAEELGLDASPSTAAAPSVDVAERLSVELPGLIVRERSLAGLVNLWTHLSGIPTIVNLDALAAAGVDREAPVSLQQIAPQAAGIVAQSLADAIGCRVLEPDNTYMLLEPPLATLQQRMPTEISWAGLLDDQDANRQWLQQTVAQLAPELDGQLSVDAGLLQLNAAPALDVAGWLAWFRVVRWIENWQLAVGGTPQLDAQRIRQPLVDPLALDKLNQRLDFFNSQPTPAGQLLSRCADQVGMQCWIDWASVGSNGLQPSSRFTSLTLNREFRRVLADYATQYNLVVALIDERTLWLTTPARYRVESRIYVLPSDGRTVEQWQQQLRPLTPVTLDGLSQLLVIPSPDEQWIIARCCYPSLRF